MPSAVTRLQNRLQVLGDRTPRCERLVGDGLVGSWLNHVVLTVNVALATQERGDAREHARDGTEEEGEVQAVRKRLAQ